MDEDNRKRALGEVVSVDAWHKAFSEETQRADLHVDVSFKTARIGDSGVRLRLTLKRAEVVVVVPELEPLKIIKSSVRRDNPKQAKLTLEQEVKSKGELKVGVAAKVGGGIKPPIAAVNAGASAAFSKSKSQRAVLRQIIDGMIVTQSKTDNGDYLWEVAAHPGIGVLDGHPWDAEKAPRLTLDDLRADRSRGLAPTVRVEVRCLREDLHIEIIAGGDPGAFELLRRKENQQNRMIAAEATVRTLLAEAGLFHEDLRDPYARITLAVTTAEAER